MSDDEIHPTLKRWAEEAAEYKKNHPKEYAASLARSERLEKIPHDDDSVVHETSGHKAHEGDHTPNSRKHPGANLEAQSDD